MSSLWGRIATKHWNRGVTMWLMTSQELVVVSYMWMAAVSLSSESFPPTASSCPCSEAHVDKATGVSASWCHTLGLGDSDKFLSHSPSDCSRQDWRRASSEQVSTDFDFGRSWIIFFLSRRFCWNSAATCSLDCSCCLSCWISCWCAAMAASFCCSWWFLPAIWPQALLTHSPSLNMH